MRRVYNAKHGDYVLCCKYSDRDPNDHWQVGFLDRVENYDDVVDEKRNVFIMQNKSRSYFKVCYFITPGEGKAIVEAENPQVAKVNGRPKRAYKKTRGIEKMAS